MQLVTAQCFCHMVYKCKPQRRTEHEGARKTDREKGTEITHIDFLTFSGGEKAGRDLPVGERARENVVRKQ